MGLLKDHLDAGHDLRVPTGHIVLALDVPVHAIQFKGLGRVSVIGPPPFQTQALSVG